MEDKTAMRDSNDNPVFVRDDGSYTYNFPEENIVNRNTDYKGFMVYYFIGKENERFGYAELSYKTRDKQSALDFASRIYGKDVNLTENVSGEVFEVEVHDM